MQYNAACAQAMRHPNAVLIVASITIWPSPGIRINQRSSGERRRAHILADIRIAKSNVYAGIKE